MRVCVAVATRRRAIEKKADIQEARDRFIAIGPGLSCGVFVVHRRPKTERIVINGPKERQFF